MLSVVSEYLNESENRLAFEGANVMVRELEILGAIVFLLAVGVVVRFVLHTRDLPHCWNCGHQEVRPAQSHWLLDDFSRVSNLYPYRCDRCQMRFYCFGVHRPRHAPS